MSGRLLVDVTVDAYHADAIDDRPTLSSSIAKILVGQTPAHARAAHPRLNPDAARTHERHFDIGDIVHALLLNQDAEVEIVYADDWRTKAAKEQREDAYLYGRIPLLERDWQTVQEIVAAARDQLAGWDAVPPLLTDGTAERTIVWEEDGVLCRTRLDWLRDDFTAIDDLKTTSRGADPAKLDRQMYDLGYDVQAAFYRRGVKALSGVDADFRFIFVETTPPYLVSVASLDPAGAALAEDRVDHALRTWKRCLETGDWPGYERRVAYVGPPAWLEARWLEKTWGETEAAA